MDAGVAALSLKESTDDVNGVDKKSAKVIHASSEVGSFADFLILFWVV